MPDNEPGLSNLVVKEEIVLCFYKDGKLAAIEKKESENIRRFTTTIPSYADTLDLFDARKFETK